ncbi:CPBP family intramembrane glutamic endopeptidase [Streptosporangium sp. NPDC000239]|uniref:CPBP family intramembrane glutamic endopeptidase n=1 Tax=unclassified Streptosporangium TaxID=2632669 RepID=UPI00332D9C52
MAWKDRGVLAYLLITFGVSWAGMFAVRLLLGMSLADPLAQLSMAFVPAIAAFVVRRWVTGEGFGDAGLALRLRSAWPYYLAAWFGPPALVVMSAGIAAATGLADPSLASFDDVLPGLPGWAFLLLLVGLIPLLSPLYWGEEFGWTGYLRLRLFPGRPVLASVVTGLIWGAWHYPLAFLGYVEYADVVAGLLIWTVSFQFQEILLGWLRQRSGSIWPSSLAHAGNNMVLFLLVGMLLGKEGARFGGSATDLIVMGPLVLASILVVVGGRGRRSPRNAVTGSGRAAGAVGAG